MKLHGASHLGQFMPREMGAIGTKMHRAASRFALAAKDAELDGGLNKAFSALAEVMQQCVACHAGYKVH
jgi:mono/diheme cytochrome c family protein